jgi:hypothetical protein
VEIGTEAAQFPEKEFINGIFFAVHSLFLCQLNDALAVEATAYALLTEYLVEGGGITIVQGFAGTPLVNFRDPT